MSVADRISANAVIPEPARPAVAASSVQRLADFPGTGRGSLVSRRVFADLVALCDLVVAAAVGIAIALMYVGEFGGAHPSLAGYLLAIGSTAGLLVVLFQALGLYKVQKFTSVVYQLPRIATGWGVAMAALAAGVFFLKIGDEFSRVWLASWFLAGSAAIMLERIVVAKVARRLTAEGRLYRRAVIFGTGEVSAEVIAQLEADAEADVRICGVFDERGGARVASERLGYPVLGSLDNLIALARSTRIDLVIVALPLSADSRIAAVVDKLSELPVEIKLPANVNRVRFAPGTYSRLGSVAMLDLLDRPQAAWGGVAKALFDKIVALAAIVLLSPVLAAVAIAVRLDSRGPILFRQKRYGFNNELIEVFKFRSMYVDMCDATASRLVTKGDPRVTPVGRFIRKTSLDELPQLFNVLLGTLSLVGPRPHAVAAKAGNDLYDQVVESYFKRHKVKPGITGWAQINGWRGETDTHEKIQKRVEHDLYYIENWSIFLDLYILVMTPLALFKTENSY